MLHSRTLGKSGCMTQGLTLSTVEYTVGQCSLIQMVLTSSKRNNRFKNRPGQRSQLDLNV